MGLSPLGVQREAMGLAMAAEEFGARMFSNGARPSGVVKIPQWLNPDQRKIARENLNDLYAGLENAHKLMLLEGGMEFDGNAAQIPPEDMQFLQLRQFQVHEICRIYRVPPHMVADLERATFSNIEQMSLEFVTYTLMPWLRRWETSIQRWLFTPGERERLYVRFNVDGLLRADSDGRSKIYSVFLQNGVMNRNEARALENMNIVEGLETYTVQSNMVPLDKIGAIADANIRRGEAPAQTRDPAPTKSGDTVVNVSTPGAPAAPATSPTTIQMGETKVELKLPDQFAHNIAHHVPELGDVAEQSRRTADLVLHMSERIDTSIKKMTALAAADRIPVLDAEGNIIASRVHPDSLH